MKRLIMHIIKTGIVLAVLTSIMFFPGCDDAVTSTTPEFDPDMNELSLLELWEMVADSTDIEEPSAQMGMFDLRCDGEGNMNYLYFTFGGRNSQGKPCIHFAQFDHMNKIDILTYETDSFAVTRHPALVFEEIDRFGLDTLDPGSEGLKVLISFTGGDVGYSNNYLDIFHLENGKLTPLDEIIFHSEVHWCTIAIYQLVPNDYTIIEDGQTSTKVITTAQAPVPPGERTSQKWFLSEDIELAETVTYLELIPVSEKQE
jgi:hypothetical protein